MLVTWDVSLVLRSAVGQTTAWLFSIFTRTPWMTCSADGG